MLKQKITVSFYIGSLFIHCTQSLSCVLNNVSREIRNDEKLESYSCEQYFKLFIEPTDVASSLKNESINKEHVQPSFTHCMVFKYIAKGVLHTRHSCDFHKDCSSNKSAYVVQKTVDANFGTLYCCKENHCNNKGEATKFNPIVSSCMHGKSQHQLNSIPCTGKMCISTKLIWSEHFNYTCDVKDLCTKYKVANNNCKDIPDYGTICCCFGEKDCNFKPRTVIPTGALPTIDNFDHSNETSNRQSQTGFIGSLAGVMILCICVLAIAAIVVKYIKRRRHISLQRDYSYQQLTADFAEEATGDDRLILA